MKGIMLAGGTVVLGENVFIDDISPYVANFQQISNT
jgi:hypothetical protein